MDLETYYRFVLALLFVLGLIGSAAWAIKRFGVERRLLGRAQGRRRRLSILEVQPLDARRKLVLLRRDTVEHLVLLSANQELLIESGIEAAEISETPNVKSEAGGFPPISIGLEALRKRKAS